MRATWESRARPARLVIVRDVSLDLVTQGRLTRRTPRRAGPLNLTTLSRYLPRSWLSIDGGTATLSAAVVLTPRVVLDVGGDVATVKLTGGATLPQAASIYTGSGRILLHGVTVLHASADPATGQPPAASPGRPFIVVTSGGRLDATDVTVTDLGTSDDGPGPDPPSSSTPAAPAPWSAPPSRATRRACSCSDRRTSASRTSPSPTRRATAWPPLRDQRHGTAPGPRRAQRRRRHPPRRHDHGAPDHRRHHAGNGRFGLAAIRLQNTRIEDMRTNGDTSGGLELSQSAGVTVSGLTAIDEPVGVFAHIGSTGITLDRLAVPAGGAGVAIEKSTRTSSCSPRRSMTSSWPASPSAATRWSCATWR